MRRSLRSLEEVEEIFNKELKLFNDSSPSQMEIKWFLFNYLATLIQIPRKNMTSSVYHKHLLPIIRERKQEYVEIPEMFSHLVETSQDFEELFSVSS